MASFRYKNIIYFCCILFLIIFSDDFISKVKADMLDPLQSRINKGILTKIFPGPNQLGIPVGNPPYIPVVGYEEGNTIDEKIMARWRIEFLQVNAREPTSGETEEKINSLLKKGKTKTIGVLIFYF